MLVRQTPLLLYEQSTPAPKNPSAQVRQELAQVRRCAEKMGQLPWRILIRKVLSPMRGERSWI